MKRTLLLLIAGSFLASLAHAHSPSYLLTVGDQNALYGSFQFAMENSPSNQATNWRNPDTGLTGTTIPLKTFKTRAGQYCREYLTSLQIGSVKQSALGTACRQPEGAWRIVSERLVGDYANLRAVNGIKAACAGKGSKHPPVGQPKSDLSTSGKYHQLHPYKNAPSHGKQFDQRGLPPGHPPIGPKQQQRQPSKLIKLVDFRHE